MELNYLKDVVTLASVHHFQDAADLLYISQSTLSKHIKAVELELGHDLFIRSRKRTELTEFGKQFLPYAQRILDIHQEYTEELLTDTTDNNDVVIGCIPMVTLYNFMGFFTKYIELNPSIKYNLIQGSSRRLLSLLHQKKVDFILTYDIQAPEDEFHKILYTNDHLIVVLPEGHRLASSKYVHIEDLETENIITLNDSVNSECFLRRQYPEYNFKTSISVEKERLLFDLIQKGLGISIMTSRFANHYEASDGIVIKDIYPLSHMNIYMIYLKNRKPSPLTKAFSQHLKKQGKIKP